MGKAIFLAVFMAMLIASFASFALADSNLGITMSSTNVSASHNAAASGSFVLNNTNTTTTATNINCSIAVAGQSWTYSCAPTSTLASNLTQTVSFSVNVPQYTAPGPYTGTITTTANYSGLAASATQTFTINVANSPSYSVSWSNFTSTLYQGQSRVVTLTISNSGNLDLTTSAYLDLSALNSSSTSLNESLGLLTKGSSVNKTVTILTTDETYVGSYTLSLALTGTGTVNTTSTSSQTLNVRYLYCDNPSNSTSRPINIEEIKNEDDLSGEDFEPLDVLKVEIKINNYDDEDKQTAVAEMVLVQRDSDLEDTDAKVKVKISDDSSETVKLNMTIPANAREGAAYIYVKVYNDDDDDNCEQVVIPINIEKSNRAVIPDKVDYSASSMCASTFTFSAEAANVGEEDEDKVDMTLTAFGKMYEDTIDNLDSGETSSRFSFEVEVPQNATVGQNKMILSFDYNYDEDDKTFDDSESFDYFTKVTCEAKKVTFTTETSTALANTQSEVRVLLSNPDTASKTYTLSASADWATIASVTPSTVTLPANGQQYVVVKLTPNKDATVGLHNLSFKATYNGATEVVNVPVNLQKSSTASGIFDKLNFQLKTNGLWIALNGALALAIIAVLVLIFSRRK